MPRRNNNANARAAFTLVELILVMVVLTTIISLVAPTLSRSFRQRNLDQEAVRFVALTEYARDEAVSNGVPTAVWVDSDHGTFSADAVTEYPGRAVARKEFSLNEGLHFDPVKSKTMKDGQALVIQFSADGSPDATVDSVDSIRIMNAFDLSAEVARTADGWSYQVVKEAGDASSKR